MASTNFVDQSTRIMASWANDVDAHVYDQQHVSLSVAQTWTKPQRGAYVSLTSSAAHIAVNLALSNNYNHELTENTTLDAPTNVVAGQSGVIHFTQHASSPKTLAFASFWKFAGGVDPTITATNSAVDVLSYVVNPAGDGAICSMIGDAK